MLSAELSARPSRPACSPSPGSNTGAAASRHTSSGSSWVAAFTLLPDPPPSFPLPSQCRPWDPSALTRPLTQPGTARSDPVRPGAQHAAPKTRSQPSFVCGWVMLSRHTQGLPLCPACLATSVSASCQHRTQDTRCPAAGPALLCMRIQLG